MHSHFIYLFFQIYGGPQHIATYNTAFASLRVLQDLTLDHLNGIPTSNIATLYEELHFDSPLEFKAIEVTSLKTEDLISGIDFDYWCDHSLTSGSRSNPQKVYKNWTIDDLYLESGMNGNGLINHLKSDEIVQSIATSKASTDDVIVGMAKEYQDFCHNIKSMSENDKTGIYFFKYFEQKFEVHGSLAGKLHNSYHFQIGNEQYMMLNVGCASEIFHWSLVEQKFVKLEEIKTGYVTEVFMLKNEFLLVLASASNVCDSKGISLFKVNVSKLIPMQNLMADVRSIHLKSYSSTFYGLIGNSKVIEYDERLQQIQEWDLPETINDYRFLPFELEIGLSLTDGRTIVALISMRSEIRQKRQISHNQYAKEDVDFSNAEWRRYDVPSSTIPPVIYNTMNPLKDASSLDSINYDVYDVYDGQPTKLSEILRKQAAFDTLKTTTYPPDYIDPTISPAWKYLHKETDIIKANIDTYKSKDLPNLPSVEEENFQNSFRSAVADVNRKIDALRDMIVTTQINNLTVLPSVGILSNFGVPFDVVRSGRTLSPNDDEIDLQNVDEANFSSHMRLEFTKWNEATYNLKDLLLKIEKNRKENELSDPIVEQSLSLDSIDKLPPLQSTDEIQFSNDLRELVSKWNQKGSALKMSLEETQTENVPDPILTQEQELKEVIKLKHPTLQSTNEKDFNDKIRGLVSKWNEKVDELKLALDTTRTTEKTIQEEPIVAQTKVLVDLIQKQLPMLQSSGETEFVQELRSLVVEWNKKANDLENVIKSNKVEEELEPILSRTNELRPFMAKVPGLQMTEEQQFSDQLREAIGNWNAVTSKLKNTLERYPNEPRVGQEHIQSTTDSSFHTTAAMQTVDEPISNEMKEQILKWNQLTQKLSDKTVMKKPTSAPVTTKMTFSEDNHVTQEPILSLTESAFTTTSLTTSLFEVKETTQTPFIPAPFIPTLTSPDDVQMIPDLKKTLFVEQTQSITTLSPGHRFSPYETTPSHFSDWQASTTEPTVAQAIPDVSVRLMENFYLPARNKGEIVLLNVGIQGMQRKLVAVSSVVNKRSTIPGQHDVIQVIF